MLHYVTRVLGLHTERGKITMTEVMPHIQSNLDCLKTMQSTTSMADLSVNVPRLQLRPMVALIASANPKLQYQAARKMVNESGSESLSFSRDITRAGAEVNEDSDRYGNLLRCLPCSDRKH